MMARPRELGSLRHSDKIALSTVVAGACHADSRAPLSSGPPGVTGHKFGAYFSLLLRKQRPREDLHYETDTCLAHGCIEKKTTAG